MIVGWPELGRLQGLSRRSHREDVGRREHLLQDRERVRQDLAQVHRLARRHARLRSLRDARPSRLPGATLVVLEEAVAFDPIGMKPYLEAPSEAQMHELRELRLYEPESDRLPHLGDKSIDLNADPWECASALRINDPSPLEHVEESARDVAGLTPALWQAVHIRASAPIERHRLRAECQSILTKRPVL